MVQLAMLVKCMTKESNAILRKKHLEWRNALEASLVKEKTSLIMKNLEYLLCSLDREYNSFLCFYPLGNEPDLRELYLKLLAKGCKLYFPVTSGEDMKFYLIDNMEDFSEGAFGVKEPINRENVFFDDVAICITPGTVFDKSGNRIGFGKGYYDRFLTKKDGILKLGIAYDGSVTDNIEPKPHDVRMNYIITESGIY